MLSVSSPLSPLLLPSRSLFFLSFIRTPEHTNANSGGKISYGPLHPPSLSFLFCNFPLSSSLLEAARGKDVEF